MAWSPNSSRRPRRKSCGRNTRGAYQVLAALRQPAAVALDEYRHERDRLNQHRHWRKEAGDDRLDKETRKSPRCAAAAAPGSLVREQRREFDQVMLRAAAANALVFGGERSEHL